MSQIEKAPLPQICQACLGDSNKNRLVRDSAKETCRLCNTPFVSYHWKLPTLQKKQTRVCYECARNRDACQSCLRDAQFSIPLGLRDDALRIMYEEGGSSEDREIVLKAVFEHFAPRRSDDSQPSECLPSLCSIISALPEVTEDMTKAEDHTTLCVYGIESDLDSASIRSFLNASIRKQEYLPTCRLAFYTFDEQPKLGSYKALSDGRLVYFAWGESISIPANLATKVGAIVREYLRSLRMTQVVNNEK